MSEANLSIEKALDFKIPTNNNKDKASQPKSPDSKTLLTKGEDGLYNDYYTGTNYKAGESGKIIPLKDPMSGGELIPNNDGTFSSKSTGKNFAFNNEHFVPLYIPDNTSEPAHIEDNRLVGNETGRSFEISDDGAILTPQEIEYRKTAQELSEKLTSFEKEANQSIIENMREAGQSLENAIKQSFLAGETNEQRNKRIKETIEIYDQQGEDIRKQYMHNLESIIGGESNQEFEPEPKLISESDPEPEQKPESDENI